jgi:hypothetical protein
MRTASSYQNSKLTALLRGVGTGSLQQGEQLFAQIWPAHPLALLLLQQGLNSSPVTLRHVIEGNLVHLDLH